MGIFENIKNKAKEINKRVDTRKAELKKINSTCNCSREVIIELNNLVNEGEKIIFFTGGTYETQYYNIFITNKKVIFIGTSGFKTTQLQIPLEKISSISTTKGLIMSKIKIWDGSSIAGVEVEKIPNNDANTFVSVINEQIDNYKSFKIEINKTVEQDITDKIEKLSELYQEGILTEYEFATKKMELLEKLKK